MALSAHTQTEKTSELEKELADALVSAGKQNMSPPGGMSDDESREWAMRNIAHPIAEAIEKGASINIKGSATVADINAMKDMAEGDIWGVTDSGTIVSPDGSTMDVSMGDLIRFDGSKWTPFIHLSLDGYATDKELEAAIAAVTVVIATHEARNDNPHNVTAEQVGAYTKAEVDAEIKKESDARELYDSQLRESIEALEEKTDDFVTGEEVSEAISAEADARIQEDIAINARIDMIPQTDWDEEDEGSMAYLQNHPTPISDLDIEALFA